MQKKEKNKWFSFSLPMGNRHHIVRARFLLFFFYLALLSLMPKWKLQKEAAVVLVWWYVVIMWKKTPNVNLLKLQSWTNDFDKKNLGFILKFDTKYWYICVLLYLTFQAVLLALPLRKNHHRKNDSIFSNQDWTLFQDFFGGKKKKTSIEIGVLFIFFYNWLIRWEQ